MFAAAVSFVLGLLACAFALPVGLLALQVVAASLPGAQRRQEEPVPRDRPALAVIVPAHDESAGLAPTIAALKPQLLPGDQLLVVADNCSDDTAEVARRAGAQVLERIDAENRGKGYALDFAVQALKASPPEVVIFVDADCLVAPGALDALARRAHASQRVLQGLYLMRPPASAGLRQRVAAFAWLLVNQVRATGAARLGMPCQLFGSGMAIPWPLLGRVSLATGHLVEDKKLGADLALAGSPPLFEARALVTSEFPTTAKASASQRTRWQQGHLDLLKNVAPKLLRSGIARRDAGAVMLACDLFVPPVSMLFLAALALGLAALGVGLLGGFGLAAGFALLTVALFFASLGLAWLRFGRHLLSAGDVLRAPLYALQAIPMYLRFAAGRRSSWVRTGRKGED
jgi:cellulose synthase/poly-beta-1,6-N-acetylglucosamine synthase-like glycosyltransferase